ncbi:MAG: Crp/Fnr family transcriptional regulator [Hansschlegelia sp.]
MLNPVRRDENQRSKRPSVRSASPPVAQVLPGSTALFLSETVEGLDDGAHFMDGLSPEELALVRSSGRALEVRSGEPVFTQGERHDGIFIIERGRVRVFYSAPSGREITLAYWTPGHFIGGPGVTGGGTHVWSGVALDDCRILSLPGSALLGLITQVPNFALCLIEGLAAKGRCYSAMAQMLGTRSVIERLAQFLLNVGDLYGVRDGRAIVVSRKITHDQIAAMVGSTRQWVTMMLKRFHNEGVVTVDARGIRISKPERLNEIVFSERD